MSAVYGHWGRTLRGYADNCRQATRTNLLERRRHLRKAEFDPDADTTVVHYQLGCVERELKSRRVERELKKRRLLAWKEANA